jgi:dihydrofolate synthase/folylpolyglutamate synthase
MKLGLENITALLARMGDPQLAVPSVLVAGTNGKGSVTTCVSSIFRQAGLKTGSFYSPHLFRINERIQIDGEEIPSADLDSILGELREHYDTTPFTFFEGVTAVAAVYFMREKVDVSVFEVGLGGRLDATRLVNAVVTVITGISKDHRQHLGLSRKKILREKLGIARSEVPLITNLDSPNLSAQACDWCAGEEIPWVDARAWRRRRLSATGLYSTEFFLETKVRDYGLVSIGMTGRVQMENATTAIRCAEIIAGRFPSVGREAILEGVKKTFLSGRFQVLPGNPRIVLDVSHNEESLLAALSTLNRIAPASRCVILIGLMARKELGRFPAIAVGSSRKIVAVTLESEGGAVSEDLAEEFRKASEAFSRDNIESPAEVIKAGGIRDGLDIARSGLGEEDILLITGSHHTVEEAARFL